ncbi:hypothetical protein HK097_000623 [Rhizophlyctis rosea]|uniref:Secreted protein n=1 Tax=Rhizophlyctis rosea TaxID=64517 RepID=A0AAD5X2G8_9FUNG|nr:hypothetical protein HK097_000623 [Rhizophlyctis rosea]
MTRRIFIACLGAAFATLIAGQNATDPSMPPSDFCQTTCSLHSETSAWTVAATACINSTQCDAPLEVMPVTAKCTTCLSSTISGGAETVKKCMDDCFGFYKQNVWSSTMEYKGTVDACPYSPVFSLLDMPDKVSNTSIPAGTDPQNSFGTQCVGKEEGAEGFPCGATCQTKLTYQCGLAVSLTQCQPESQELRANGTMMYVCAPQPMMQFKVLDLNSGSNAGNGSTATTTKATATSTSAAGATRTQAKSGAGRNGVAVGVVALAGVAALVL